MNRIFLLSFFIFLPILLFTQSKRTNEFKHITTQIIKYDIGLNLDKIPGYIMGMIDKDSTYMIQHGVASKTAQSMITEHTVFEIGSFSKIFTMSLVAVLVDEGLLSYQTNINDLLPRVAYNNTANSISLEDLLMHTSGLPKIPSDLGLKQKNPDDPYSDYTKEDVLAYYSTFNFGTIEKKAYAYSHINYALVEIIIEHICKKSYESLLTDKIIAPLNLKDTYLGVSEKLYKKAAKGYNLIGEEVEFKTYQSFEAALGIKSSLHDLLILIKTYLGLNHVPLSNNLNKVLEKRMITDRFIKNLKSGYAWHYLQHKSYYDVVVHPGRVNGYQVTVHFVPETQTAVIILANTNESLKNLGYLTLALVNNHWKLGRKERRKWKRKKKQK